MTRISFDLLWKWMLVLSLGTVVLGLVLCVVPGRALPGLLTAYDEGMLAPFFGDSPSPEAILHYRFQMGLLGVALMGWGTAYAFVAAGPFRRRERWAWWSFTAGIATWIGCEVVLCLAYGVYVEIWFLGAAAIGTALPLALSWKHMQAGTEHHSPRR